MTSPELASLGEANDVEAVLEFWILGEVLADDVDLIVDILEESVQHVLFNVVPDHDGA